MAVDHGLQGKNSDKSRQKRAKRSAKFKVIAMNALTKDNKVLFDEKSREQWLTGFRERKQERRKYGLAMQLLKNKKVIKEKAKDRRKAIQESTNFASVDEIEESGDIILATVDEKTFEDHQTQEMFGSSVTVVIDNSISDTLDERANPDQYTNGIKKFNNRTQESFKSKLERAMDIVGKTMNNRKSTKPNKNYAGKSNSNQKPSKHSKK